MRQMFLVFTLLAMLAGAAIAQEQTTFTGSALIYGSGFNTRTVTRTFTLRIKGATSDSDTTRYLKILQDGGQDDLLKAVRNQDVGNFSLGGQLARTLNAVRVENIGGGKTRIRAIFERWLGFGELRAGSRSVDYPFGYLELIVDSRTGKGEGTFIPAAQIRFKTKNGQSQVEVEDFGTFPGRLMGVTMRGRMP